VAHINEENIIINKNNNNDETTNTTKQKQMVIRLPLIIYDDPWRNKYGVGG
jgi:hypothetical protein